MNSSQIESAITDYLSNSPFSLVIRETCRIHAIQGTLGTLIKDDAKILDVGCGDGNWWKILGGNRKFDVDGIDINASEVEKAQGIINAKKVDITNVGELTQIRRDYDLAIGNCSLEHIPDIDSALKNIFTLLKPEATFILFVPTPYWALKGKSVQFLNSISPRLSMMISGMINGFFQHWHLYHHSLWKHILKSNGFEVEEVKGLGSEKLEFLFRLYLPSSFFSFLVKKITGKYFNRLISPLVPSALYESEAKKLAPLISASLTSADDENAFEYMIIAKRIKTLGP